MDYIQEELRRQREALAAVLLGGESRQSSEDDREADRLSTGALSAVRPTAAETALGSAVPRRTRSAAEGSTAGEGGSPAALGGGLSGGGTAHPGKEATAPAAESGGAGPAALRERGLKAPSPAEAEVLGAKWTAAGSGSPAAKWSRVDAGGSAPPEARRSRVDAVGSAAPEARRSRVDAVGSAVPEARRTVTELVYPAGGGASVTAEALSRAFQRDARRYDGGFSPY